MGRQAGRRFHVRSARGCRARVDDQVDHRQEMPVLSEVLADPALDTVPRHGAARGANTDCQPEPWVIETVQFRAHEKERVRRT